MVIIHRDIKRKRKNENIAVCSILPDIPKRTKVQAQRKFAQGSNVSPVITPVQEIEMQEKLKSESSPELEELLPMIRPHTEDFLTFLCFRGTSMLPPNLNFFNTAPANSRTRAPTLKTEKVNNYSPIVNLPSKTSNGNDRPFIAFGVRKRADPVLVSKHMDKKRRHALALQALRRKYQEQKMAKIRAITISKLSEKCNSGRGLISTRSVSKSSDLPITKKLLTQNTAIKVVSTKHIKVTPRDAVKLQTRLQTKLKLKTSVKSQVKKKMCLRSFRGRFIQHELSLRKVRKRRPSLINEESRQPSSNLLNKATSEFSSDDDQPLAKSTRSSNKCAPKLNKKCQLNIKKTVDARITRKNQPLSSDIEKFVKHKAPQTSPFVNLTHSKNIVPLHYKKVLSKTKSCNLKKSEIYLELKTSPRLKRSIVSSGKNMVNPKSNSSITTTKSKFVCNRNLKNRNEKTNSIKHNKKLKCISEKVPKKCDIVLGKNGIEKIIQKSDRELRNSSDKNETIKASEKKVVVESSNTGIKKSYTKLTNISEKSNKKFGESRNNIKHSEVLPIASEGDNPHQNLRSNAKNEIECENVTIEEKTDLITTNFKKISEKCEVILEKCKVEDISVNNNRDLKCKKNKVVSEKLKTKEINEEHNRNLRPRSIKLERRHTEESSEKKENDVTNANEYSSKSIKEKAKVSVVSKRKSTINNAFLKSDVFKLKRKAIQLPDSKRTLKVKNQPIKKQQTTVIKKNSQGLISQITHSTSRVLNNKHFVKTKFKNVEPILSGRIRVAVNSLNKASDYLLRNKLKHISKINASSSNPKKVKQRSPMNDNEDNKIKNSNNIKSVLHKCKTEDEKSCNLKEFSNSIKSESCDRELQLVPLVEIGNECNNKQEKCLMENTKESKNNSIINKTEKFDEICDNEIFPKSVKNDLKSDNASTIVVKNENHSIIKECGINRKPKEECERQPKDNINPFKSKTNFENDMDKRCMKQKRNVFIQTQLFQKPTLRNIDTFKQSTRIKNVKQKLSGSICKQNSNSNKNIASKKTATDNVIQNRDKLHVNKSNFCKKENLITTKKLEIHRSENSVKRKNVDVPERHKVIEEINNVDDMENKNKFPEKSNHSAVNAKLAAKELCIIDQKNTCHDDTVQIRNVSESQSVIEKLAEKFTKTAKISEDEPLCKLKSSPQEGQVSKPPEKVDQANSTTNKNFLDLLTNENENELQNTNVEFMKSLSDIPKLDSNTSELKQQLKENERALQKNNTRSIKSNCYDKVEDNDKMENNTTNSLEKHILCDKDIINILNVEETNADNLENDSNEICCKFEATNNKDLHNSDINQMKEATNDKDLQNSELNQMKEYEIAINKKRILEKTTQFIDCERRNEQDIWHEIHNVHNKTENNVNLINKFTCATQSKINCKEKKIGTIESDCSTVIARKSDDKQNSRNNLNNPDTIVQILECENKDHVCPDNTQESDASTMQKNYKVNLENIVDNKIQQTPTKETQTALKKSKTSCNEILPRRYTKRRTKQEPIVEEPRVQRPSRKTKEAAAIYMEILGHKLVEDDIDDDSISIDSFPELPNVRKMEQRENELKAKANSIINKNALLEASKQKRLVTDALKNPNKINSEQVDKIKSDLEASGCKDKVKINTQKCLITDKLKSPNDVNIKDVTYKTKNVNQKTLFSKGYIESNKIVKKMENVLETHLIKDTNKNKLHKEPIEKELKTINDTVNNEDENDKTKLLQKNCKETLSSQEGIEKIKDILEVSTFKNENKTLQKSLITDKLKSTDDVFDNNDAISQTKNSHSNSQKGVEPVKSKRVEKVENILESHTSNARNTNNLQKCHSIEALKSSDDVNKSEAASKSVNLQQIHKECVATCKDVQKVENLTVHDNTVLSSSTSNYSKSAKTELLPVTKRPMRSAAQTKPFIDFSFSDSDYSFFEEKHATVSKTLKTRSVRNKNCAKNVNNKNNSESDESVQKDVKSIKLDDTKKVNNYSQVSNKSSKKSKKKIALKHNTKASESCSFSDSDEEPLSKFTQVNRKSVETIPLKFNHAENKESSHSETKQPLSKGTSVTVDNQTVVVVEVRSNFENTEKLSLLGLSGKPKRECTKIPQNYLPLPSSSDEDDTYVYPAEKIKSMKRMKTADLLCKDLDKRFGKGKVNMSTEQIEKWLNDSALAGEISCKENDDILKYTEISPVLSVETTKTDIPAKPTKGPSTVKSFKSTDACDNTDCITSEVQNFQFMSKQCERKTIFRKERKLLAPNINAFSANNEASVYAFEADNEDSISTPFRRPSRRPSSTATSKSEESYKYDEYNKTLGHFRVPSVIKQDFGRTVTKQEVTVILSKNLPTETSLHIDLDDPEAVNIQTSEVKQGSQTNDVHAKPSPSDPNSQKTTLCSNLATNVATGCSRFSENNSSMDPPPITFQRTRSTETKSYLRARTFDRMSDNSEDFKYKVPSSPSASSSSSTAKVTQKAIAMKTRIRPIEICTPVVGNDFPPNQNPALVFEAPLFYPNEKEFQDPLEYIAKIRPQAEQFGICRIVPPSTFKPECKLSDEMRFTAYNQYVHKMLHRWGPNFKEFMAMMNYLKTQSIALTHPPLIGGVEIDLPRLYQVVQSLGGLKEVIEKKKWPKVAEFMKIPKCAQDRLTKLDGVYCKYLLPYETLSLDEKEKLFDEVETDWAKRESRGLLKSQQNTNNRDHSSNSDESDTDNEIEECTVKGRSMALNGFYRIARNTMSMWFKTMEPPAEEVEQEFWKHVTHKQNHICVHSGSIDSGNHGYGFAVSKNSPFARHAWNLKVLTNNTGSILRSLGPVTGVTIPTIHVGMVFSACCWYRDPHSLPWIEYLHTGGSKIWYGIPDSMSKAFHSTLLKLVPNYCHNKSIWLPSDTVMVPPSLLVENGVSISRTIQEPGQFVVVFPKAFTSCICTAYVVSESVYFAPMSWLSTADKVFEELQNNCEPTMFSLERLMVSVASDVRTSVDVMRQIIPYIQSLIEREEGDIKQLNELGLNNMEKLPIPEVAVKKKKKFQDDNGCYECEQCSKNLFISWVSESDDSTIYCLTHARDHIKTKRIELKNCKLYYTYNKEDMLTLIEKIKLNIDIKLQKKMIGKSAVATQW